MAATATAWKRARKSASSAWKPGRSPPCASRRRNGASGARSNTATATTATADPPATGGSLRYRGRFAPSPTGPLHLGSLLAAVGSYLQARAAGGQWLLRMEDLDTPRVVPGAADGILRILERFGLQWDGPVLYQSQRHEAYAAALAQLQDAGLVFPCSCSRRELHSEDGLPGEESYYPGTCRHGMRDPSRAPALRFRVSSGLIGFTDGLQGRYDQDVGNAVGDFVVRRRDGVFAYQLAVVVDDAEQEVTEVVRGCDLLSNTPRQIALQRQLGLPQPAYVHLPLLMQQHAGKLSKSRGALPLDGMATQPTLRQVLELLGQNPPPELERVTLSAVWDWAIAHWRPQALQGVRTVLLD